MDEWLPLAGIFLVVTGLLLGLYLLFRRRPQPDRLRAADLDGDEPPRPAVFGKLTSPLAEQLPPRPAVRARTGGRAVERGLPLAIDLLTLCLSAGQNLLAALQQTTSRLRPTHPVLGQELMIVRQQAELHSLEYALRQWADRVRLPEVRNLALLLIQSEKLGTDAASTLMELSGNFRTTARQRAEAQANRTSFWMLIPSVFCFWVASAIILIGPAYLEFFQQQRRSTQLFNQSRKNIERANEGNKTKSAVTGTAADAQGTRPR